MSQIKLEIACNHYQSCVHAQQGGADRIELFENLPEGGCTPSYGMIKRVKDTIALPIYVMIRPRGGDFCYSDEEFTLMQYDVEQCLQLGVDGIVFGILTSNGEVDTQRCKQLQALWQYKPITFHRAVDRSADIMTSVKTITDLGFERVLTSGGQRDVSSGKEIIKQLQQTFGKDIVIMPGAGITVSNIRSVVDFCGTSEVHATAKIERASTTGSVNSLFQDKLSESDVEQIQAMLAALR